MTDLCKPLRIIEQQLIVLHETVVANPDAITKYTEQFSALVRDATAKEWFRKKLRAALINSPPLLRQVTQQSSSFPAYANTALANGEPVYAFDPDNHALQALEVDFHHVADWFNAMHDLLTRDPANDIERHDHVLTQREFSKIMRYSPEVAVQRANEWFRLIGTRLTGQKDGVEVVMTWPDGYYAVRYTDRSTMMIDGQDLQNCLQTGTYWNNVEGGANAIYGIRKPNDEAVVGIRTEKLRYYSGDTSKIPVVNKLPLRWTVAECKGKNNQPVSAAYRRYVIDLLNNLHTTADFVNPGSMSDLTNAGIFLSDEGKFGSFEDAADLVYDENGLKIWRTSTKAIARVGRNEVEISLVSKAVTDIAASDRMTPAMMMRVLNGLKLPPSPRSVGLHKKLEDLGIIYSPSEHRFELLDTAGRLLLQDGPMKVISLGNRCLLMLGGKPMKTAILRDKATISEIQSSGAVDIVYVIAFLNAIDVPPSDLVELHIAEFGIGWDGKRYGAFDSIAVPEIAIKDGPKLCRMGQKRNRWFIVDGQRFVLLYGITRLRIVGTLSNDRDEEYLLRELVRRQKFTSVYDMTSDFGMLAIPNQPMVTSLPEFFANLGVITELMTTKFEGLPIRLDTQVVDFLRYYRLNGDPHGDGALPKNYAKLLAQHLMPVKGRRAILKNEGTHQVGDMSVNNLEILLPMAAIELCDAKRIPVPSLIYKGLAIFVRQAILHVKQHPGNFYRLDQPGPLYLKMDATARTAINDLNRAIGNNNSQLSATLHDKLKDDNTDISSRFAALNLLNRKRE